jgi:uncharacterized protein with HEPN domain
MNENRLSDYIDHIQEAAADVCSFVQGLDKDDFLADKRTQQAVIMSLIIIGEAATKVMEGYAAFAQAHPDVPWRNMRGMRNRMAHGTRMAARFAEAADRRSPGRRWTQ